MLAKACLPLLKKAAKTNEALPMGVARAAIINMSSILGSIQGNTDGGMYAYRTSKSALNAATKSLSIDLYPQRIMCVSLHPGWVKTDMGGSNAPLDVPTSTGQIVETIRKLGEQQNGGFVSYDGSPLSW
ncbi:C-factor isoform X2 [Drosophila gunungcola]|nr:C-factor isoform X2 [Drosophila gunungcola]